MLRALDKAAISLASLPTGGLQATMASSSNAERVSHALAAFRNATSSGKEDPLHQSMADQGEGAAEEVSKLDRLLHRLASPGQQGQAVPGEA